MTLNGDLDKRPDATSEITIGEVYRQQSFFDHLFIVTNSMNQCLGIWTAQEIASLKSVRSKGTSGASRKASNDYERFSGNWCGFWNNNYQGQLDVTWMNRDGDVRGAYYFLGKGWEFNGKITDGKLEFALPGGAKLRYWFKGDGTLFGTHQGRSTINTKPC